MARSSWLSDFTSSATCSRGSTPRVSTKPEGDAAHGAFEPFGFVELDQGLDHLGDVTLDEFLQARLNRFAIGSVQLIVGNDVDARLERRGRRRAIARSASPASGCGRRGRGSDRDRRDAATALARAVISAATADIDAAFSVRPCTSLGGAVGNELKALDAADIFALHVNRAVFLDCRHQLFLLRQAFHQHAGAAVDKTRSQPFMQGVR